MNYNDLEASIYSCTFQAQIRKANILIKFPCNFFVEWRTSNNRVSVNTSKVKPQKDEINFNQTLNLTTEMIYDNKKMQFLKKESLIHVNLISKSRPDQVKLVGRVSIDLSMVLNVGMYSEPTEFKLNFCSVDGTVIISFRPIQQKLTTLTIYDLQRSAFGDIFSMSKSQNSFMAHSFAGKESLPIPGKESNNIVSRQSEFAKSHQESNFDSSQHVQNLLIKTTTPTKTKYTVENMNTQKTTQYKSSIIEKSFQPEETRKIDTDISGRDSSPITSNRQKNSFNSKKYQQIITTSPISHNLNINLSAPLSNIFESKPSPVIQNQIQAAQSKLEQARKKYKKPNMSIDIPEQNVSSQPKLQINSHKFSRGSQDNIIEKAVIPQNRILMESGQIDLYKKQNKQLKDEISKQKLEINDLNRYKEQINKNKGEDIDYTLKLVEQETQRKQLIQRIQQLSGNDERISRENSELKNKIINLIQKNSDLERLSNNYQNSNDNTNQLKLQIDNLKEEINLKQNLLQQFEETVERLQSDMQNLQNNQNSQRPSEQLSSQKNNHDQLNNNIYELNKKISQLESNSQHFSQINDQLQSEIKALCQNLQNTETAKQQKQQEMRTKEEILLNTYSELEQIRKKQQQLSRIIGELQKENKKITLERQQLMQKCKQIEQRSTSEKQSKIIILEEKLTELTNSLQHYKQLENHNQKLEEENNILISQNQNNNLLVSQLELKLQDAQEKLRLTEDLMLTTVEEKERQYTDQIQTDRIKIIELQSLLSELQEEKTRIEYSLKKINEQASESQQSVTKYHESIKSKEQTINKLDTALEQQITKNHELSETIIKYMEKEAKMKDTVIILEEQSKEIYKIVQEKEENEEKNIRIIYEKDQKIGQLFYDLERQINTCQGLKKQLIDKTQSTESITADYKEIIKELQKEKNLLSNELQEKNHQLNFLNNQNDKIKQLSSQDIQTLELKLISAEQHLGEEIIKRQNFQTQLKLAHLETTARDDEKKVLEQDLKLKAQEIITLQQHGFSLNDRIISLESDLLNYSQRIESQNIASQQLQFQVQELKNKLQQATQQSKEAIQQSLQNQQSLENQLIAFQSKYEELLNDRQTFDLIEYRNDTKLRQEKIKQYEKQIKLLNIEISKQRQLQRSLKIKSIQLTSYRNKMASKPEFQQINKLKDQQIYQLMSYKDRYNELEKELIVNQEEVQILRTELELVEEAKFNIESNINQKEIISQELQEQNKRLNDEILVMGQKNSELEKSLFEILNKKKIQKDKLPKHKQNNNPSEQLENLKIQNTLLRNKLKEIENLKYLLAESEQNRKRTEQQLEQHKIRQEQNMVNILDLQLRLSKTEREGFQSTLKKSYTFDKNQSTDLNLNQTYQSLRELIAQRTSKDSSQIIKQLYDKKTKQQEKDKQSNILQQKTKYLSKQFQKFKSQMLKIDTRSQKEKLKYMSMFKPCEEILNELVNYAEQHILNLSSFL